MSAPQRGLLLGGGGSAAGGGCLVWGVSAPRGVPGPRGCLLLGGAWSGGVGIPACTEADTLPPVDRHTLVKILPWPNFVAAGKNVILKYDLNQHKIAVIMKVQQRRE